MEPLRIEKQGSQWALFIWSGVARRYVRVNRFKTWRDAWSHAMKLIKVL